MAVLQVIFALPAANGQDYAMRIFNSDGSEPEMCGNGIRCLAKFVADRDGKDMRLHKVHTLAGADLPLAHTSACPATLFQNLCD